jgi:hypothetical protein
VPGTSLSARSILVDRARSLLAAPRRCYLSLSRYRCRCRSTTTTCTTTWISRATRVPARIAQAPAAGDAIRDLLKRRCDQINVISPLRQFAPQHAGTARRVAVHAPFHHAPLASPAPVPLSLAERLLPGDDASRIENSVMSVTTSPSCTSLPVVNNASSRIKYNPRRASRIDFT